MSGTAELERLTGLLAADLAGDLTEVPDDSGGMREKSAALLLKAHALQVKAGELAVLADLRDAQAEADAHLERAAEGLRAAKEVHDTAAAVLAGAEAELAEARRRAACVADGTGDSDMSVRIESRALRVALAEEIGELETVREGHAAAAQTAAGALARAKTAMADAQQAVDMLGVAVTDPMRWGRVLPSWRAAQYHGAGWWRALEADARGADVDRDVVDAGRGMVEHLLDVTGRRREIQRAAAEDEYIRIMSGVQLGGETVPPRHHMLPPGQGWRRGG